MGGIGIAPGANLSDTVAMFEATHGTAPKYAGKDYVNPGSEILSAEMMLRQVRTNGLAGMVDAVIFSSQIGRRKPAPEAYRAALEAVGAGADSALFVGDRFREDYEGPRSVGMRAVICTAHAAEPPPHGTATIVSLRELRGLL